MDFLKNADQNLENLPLTFNDGMLRFFNAIGVDIVQPSTKFYTFIKHYCTWYCKNWNKIT